jgi:hemerythrin-like domain-containing protein
MSNETAVHRLEKHISKLLEKRQWHSKDFLIERFNEAFKEALKLEQEQLFDAIRYTIEEQYWRKTWANCDSTLDVAEEYYYNTFKANRI